MQCQEQTGPFVLHFPLGVMLNLTPVKCLTPASKIWCHPACVKIHEGAARRLPWGDAHAARRGDAHTARRGDAHTTRRGDAHTTRRGDAQAARRRSVSAGTAHAPPRLLTEFGSGGSGGIGDDQSSTGSEPRGDGSREIQTRFRLGRVTLRSLFSTDHCSAVVNTEQLGSEDFLSKFGWGGTQLGVRPRSRSEILMDGGGGGGEGWEHGV